MFGSSPPARGTPTSQPQQMRSGRFIPARAGNTRYNVYCLSCPTVHPRPRGEHTLKSPWKVFPVRFIPARAGNTFRCKTSEQSSTVHPRPRGEHCETRGRDRLRLGSSPPARGTRSTFGGCGCLSRFIPARAGNTWESLFTNLDPATVHPRPRGEHNGELLASADSLDVLPVHPRPRGEHITSGARLDALAKHLRFIPARAGNTAWSTRSAWRTLPDGSSPPARGTPEILALISLEITSFGSSPPARGTLGEVSSHTEPTSQSVHPRPRGEHST